MTVRNGDVLGQPITEVDTPALLLDLSALEANIQYMSDFFAGQRSQLRPHFKTHKCTTISRMQMAAGAVGVACAKLSEAEVLVAAGIGNILIANQVVGTAKMPRLADLARRCHLMVAVDSPANIAQLSSSAQAAEVTVGVLVEIDIGMARCGVAPGLEALELAHLVGDSPGLRFDGLQAYEGHAVLLRDSARRRTETLQALGRASKTRGLIADAGLPVTIVSGGGTGTYDITGTYPGIDEVQAGSYVTMDWYYHDIRPEFQQAISVLTSIISQPRPETAVLDVGVKGVGAEFGPPRVRNYPSANMLRFGSEEHCVVDIADSTASVGTKLELVPSHGCTTCNLHRQFIVHREGRIENVWPIEGSGCLT